MNMTKRSIRKKVMMIILAVCMIFTVVPVTVMADTGDTEIKEVNINFDVSGFKYGDTIRPIVSIADDSAHYTIAYERWDELEHEEGQPWHIVASWYSDPSYGTSEFTSFEYGKHYSLDIVLKANEGYTFADLSNLKYIRNGSEGLPLVNLALKKNNTFFYAYSMESLDFDPISNIEVTKATLSYKAGDTPQATARGNNYNTDVQVYDEYWEEMETNASGEAVPVKFWHSNPTENAKVAEDKRITTFEEGKRYMYSLTLKARYGHMFADGCTMTLNGETVNAINIIKSDEYTRFAMALKTIKIGQTTTDPSENPGKPEEPKPSDDNQNSDSQVEAFAKRMYTVVLNREAEAEGLSYWTNRLINQEIDGAGTANGFINSAEFQARKLDDTDFVDVLYRTFFDRNADEGGRSYWLSELAKGVSRTQVLSGFVNSQEFSQVCDSYGIARGTMQTDGTCIYKPGVRNFVSRMYTKALNRNGETMGVEYWANRINMKVASPETVAKSFFLSEEFNNRKLSDEDYVETLYQTFMDRASDAEGKQYWVSNLKNGMSREKALEGFARSTEFSKIMKSFGL